MNGYAIGRQNGWMSANDIRALENLDPIQEEEGGNLYLVNGNMCKLRDAGSAYSANAPAANADPAAPPYQPDETPEPEEEKPPESGNKHARKPRKETSR